ncbi:hypothetical protein K435DRAFT_485022 [Dendrothele bispora CBS 962.96]|uniref:Transmembrane protein n=1 Tax=Dendrothele bispora (strain CBS 962.96) TaxID=1314807 RepID=A0A4S8MBC2_DENBC|nr:hypothetical protein K435DRAFT_485022 [Dendrothele bispora CBS 962.96]
MLWRVMIRQPGVIVCPLLSKRRGQKQSRKVGEVGNGENKYGEGVMATSGEGSEMGGFRVEENERMWVLRDENDEVGGGDSGEDRKGSDGKGDGGDGGVGRGADDWVLFVPKWFVVVLSYVIVYIQYMKLMPNMHK